MNTLKNVSNKTKSMEINKKKERLGWYFYDWANSAFPATVITVFLGPYLTSIANSAADETGMLHIFGLPIASGSLFPFVVSLSVILQVLFLPIVGAITDRTNIKKTILGITAYIGSFATLGLFFVHSDRYLLGALLFIIANVAFGCSVVVYNSILNDIAEIDERDDVSSKGWAFGYIGGGLLLLLNLLLFSNAEALGLSTGFAVRICLASAGAWWAIFTIIPLLHIRKYKYCGTENIKSISLIKQGFNQFWHTFKKAKKYPETLLFLLAYLLYNDGVQAVIAMSAQFGQEELKLDMSFLTLVILIIQFVAFGGSLFFNYLAKLTTTKSSLIISLIIWLGAVVFAFGFLNSSVEFMILGAVIGFVLGGTQALSRSLFSKMLPKGEEAEYFSFYEIGERGTSWLAPFIFGLVYQFSGSYRYAILSIVIFFILGLLILLKVDIERAIREANPS